MQREEYVYQAGKVSLLFADSDRSQCRAVELYAQEHAYVELCAAVTDAASCWMRCSAGCGRRCWFWMCCSKASIRSRCCRNWRYSAATRV